MYPLLTFFLLIYRGSQFLQFTTKLNPSKNIRFSESNIRIIRFTLYNTAPKLIQTVIQIQLFCIHGFIIIPQNKSFYKSFASYFQDFKLLFKTKQKKSIL